jgi:hypothetical protein
MGIHKYRLFVLGAGFSKPANYPLGDELLDRVRVRVKAQFQPYGWDGPLEQEIEEWRELYPEKHIALESILAYSHRKHFLKLIGSEEYFSHGSRSIVAARQAIQEILIGIKLDESLALYTEFAKHLTPYDTVLTFNYDTLLEDTLERIGKPYSLTPEWWLADSSDSSTQEEFAYEYVDVIKLHGSIDWYDKNYYPDRDPIFGTSASIPIESLARGTVENEWGENLLSRVFRVVDHRKHFLSITEASHQVVPFLLPPAHDKLLGHDPIRDLWQNMHRTLDAYSVIIIIGYSMPQYDGYAYEALGNLILNYQAGDEKTFFGHRRVPIQIITLASSKNDVFTNIPFLKRKKSRIWYKGFTRDSLNWIDWGD